MVCFDVHESKGRDVPIPGNDKADSIVVVIPCYRESARVLKVIEGIGNEVRNIIVVDDACPEGTGETVRNKCDDSRVEVLNHDKNLGVGGATLSG